MPEHESTGWYYESRGEQRGPISETGILNLYRAGIIKDDTPVLTHGFVDWKPFSSSGLIRPLTNSVPPSIPIRAAKGKTKNAWLWGIPLTALLIVGGIFVYQRFLAPSPLEGGWEEKNVLGVTTDVMLFEGNHLWEYDNQNGLTSVSCRTEPDGNNAYRVTLSKDGNSMVLLITMQDKNTIEASIKGTADIGTMTRISKDMAKNIMGIH